MQMGIFCNFWPVIVSSGSNLIALSGLLQNTRLYRCRVILLRTNIIIIIILFLILIKLAEGDVIIDRADNNDNTFHRMKIY